MVSKVKLVKEMEPKKRILKFEVQTIKGPNIIVVSVREVH
jgi:hypothetical protein